MLLFAKTGTIVFLLTLAVLGYQVFGADFHGHSISMGVFDEVGKAFDPRRRKPDDPICQQLDSARCPGTSRQAIRPFR